MKMRNIILATILMMAVSACTKKDVGPVSFNVTTDSVTYHLGDTVKFELSGNPDYIVFYSGENGHRYQYRNRTSAPGGTPILNFSSYEQYGTHTNTLHLLVSNNFDGNYDASAVDSATWIDITNRATLSTGQNNTPSGNISLSDFVSQDTPVYVAFKFADQYDGVVAQRTWTITGLSLVNYLPDSTSSTLLNLNSSIWLGVPLINTSANWVVSTASLKITGGNASAPSNEAFAISQPVNLTTVSPDMGVPIKTYSDNPLSIYRYIFTKRGTYTVTFDARNANIYSGTEAVKTVTVTIQ